MKGKMAIDNELTEKHFLVRPFFIKRRLSTYLALWSKKISMFLCKVKNWEFSCLQYGAAIA